MYCSSIFLQAYKVGKYYEFWLIPCAVSTGWLAYTYILEWSAEETASDVMEGKPLFRSRLAVTLKQASIGKPIRHHLWSTLRSLIFKYQCCWTSASVVADCFTKARESACQRYRWVKTWTVSNCNVASRQQSRDYPVFCVGYVSKRMVKSTCVCVYMQVVSLWF
jgi:hypothetical protein